MKPQETTYAQEAIRKCIQSKQSKCSLFFQDNDHSDYSDYSDYDDIIYSESYSWTGEYSL